MSGLRVTPLHAAAFLAGLVLVGQLSTGRQGRRYYQDLKRPGFAPPAWTLPVVWGGLNALQLWADRRLVNDRGIEGRNTLLGLRGANWALEGLFNPLFFRARSPVLGEAVRVAQTLNTLATIFAARRTAPGVAVALTPLAGWLTFASTVAGWIAVKNPDPVMGAVRRHFVPATATIH